MWTILIALSALVGTVCGLVVHGRRAAQWGAAVPWLAFLLWQLYHEYVAPASGGGASMWPIAQLVAGTVAAVIGWIAAFIASRAKRYLRP